MNSRSSSEIFESSAGEFLTTKNHTMAHATPMEPVGKTFYVAELYLQLAVMNGILNHKYSELTV